MRRTLLSRTRGLFISPQRQVVILSAISYGYSMLVLNRWAFTDLRERSFGRLWMYFISWRDFGFTRRALLGTILSETRINKIFENEYLFAYIFSGVLLLTCLVLVTRQLLANSRLASNPWLCAVILLSPASFAHLSYSTGTLDLPLVALLLVGCFYARRPMTLSLIAGLGIMVHELFLFMVPAMVAVFLLRTQGSKTEQKSLILVSGASMTSTLLVAIFGRSNASRQTVDEVMARLMPGAVGEHPLWSGYLEITSTTGDNLGLLRNLQAEFADNWLWALLPCLYVICLGWVIWRFLEVSPSRRFLYIGVAFAPILTSVVATDFYRWLSVSAIAFLILIATTVGLGMMVVPRRVLIGLVCFSVLAPFGGAGLGRPFPLHQEIGEKIHERVTATSPLMKISSLASSVD